MSQSAQFSSGSKDQDNSPRVRSNSNRAFYDVEAGDSLASIALKRLQDTRFARLIFTINRGEIPIRCDGFNTFAFIFPGQRILLPTKGESEIYRKNFLTESSRSKFDLAHYARPAMPSDSIPAELYMQKSKPASWGEPVAEVKSAAPNLVTAQASMYSIKPSIAATALEPHFIPITSKVAADTNKEAQAKTIDMRPPQNDEPRIEAPFPKPSQYKSTAIKQADDQDLFFSQGSLEITSLSHYCRVMKFESLDENADLLVKLQVFDNQRWQTISSYTIKRELTQRSSHYADGTVDRVNIDLPTSIAKELSINDFTKNWKNYTKVYFNHKEQTRLEQIATASNTNVGGKTLRPAI